MFIPEITEAQKWGGARKPGFWDNWAVNVNAGLTSFYGDLSIYDSEIMQKLKNESGPAMGLIVTKSFNDKFGVSGQFLMRQATIVDNVLVVHCHDLEQAFFLTKETSVR